LFVPTQQALLPLQTKKYYWTCLPACRYHRKTAASRSRSGAHSPINQQDGHRDNVRSSRNGTHSPINQQDGHRATGRPSSSSSGGGGRRHAKPFETVGVRAARRASQGASDRGRGATGFFKAALQQQSSGLILVLVLALQELTSSQAELLERIQKLKHEVQNWRSNVETQVKTYQNELQDLKKGLDSEVEQLKSAVRSAVQEEKGNLPAQNTDFRDEQ
uniref:Uncharacterized protein n=1 Tax=Zea mays TaxID=4577 RepID=A0A804MTX0_MAIZE